MLQGHKKAKHKASKEDEIHCSIPPKGASSIVEHINDGGNFIWHNCRETEIHEVRCKHLSKAGNFSALLGDRAWLGDLEFLLQNSCQHLSWFKCFLSTRLYRAGAYCSKCTTRFLPAKALIKCQKKMGEKTHW